MSASLKNEKCFHMAKCVINFICVCITLNVITAFADDFHGTYFEVVTTATASVHSQELSFGEATWFPGYAWKISHCPRCGYHLGWEYVPMDSSTAENPKSFFGLILGNLLFENEADNLILIPKSYRS
ncbi:hypothetical protein CHS0354_034477 [Potamilus streckersoni]|uniref:CULT domain-containing protein n=1 Tax=Potamilus streckersoni TaxID=2493646 RepID=A0AAE0T1S0_9BIVA|nr:hypothetical protein CHS0354_034477 [Potamilus streckersoni]